MLELREVTTLLSHYATKCARAAAELRELIDEPVAWLHGETQDVHDDPYAPPPGFGREPWVPVKSAAWALHDVMRPLANAWQLTPNRFNEAVFGGATPLASMVAGGLLGAGGGYLAGRLAESVLPEAYVEPGRLRRSTALLGGLAGLAPGAVLGHNNVSTYGRYGHPHPWRGLVEPNLLFGYPEPESGLTVSAALARLPETVEAVRAELRERGLADDPRLVKAAGFADAGYYMPDVPVDRFGRELWADPLTPEPVAAAATGLLDAASRARGGSPYVSPADIGRVALGAGSGLLSATLVGKVLGALGGLTPDAQRQLQQAGLWAGALRNVVPLAFGL